MPQNTDYDPANSLVFFENDRKRPGKKDPEFTGTLTDANGKEHWLSIWPKTNQKTGAIFWTGSFRPKEHNDAPRSNRPAPARGGSSMSRRRVDDGDDIPD